MIVGWIVWCSNQEGFKCEPLARIVFDGFAMQALAGEASRVAQCKRLIRVGPSDIAPKLEELESRCAIEVIVRYALSAHERLEKVSIGASRITNHSSVILGEVRVGDRNGCMIGLVQRSRHTACNHGVNDNHIRVGEGLSEAANFWTMNLVDVIKIVPILDLRAVPG